MSPCPLCKAPIIYGVICEHADCRAKVHVHCQRKWFQRHDHTCVECKKEWTAPLPGGAQAEKPASDKRGGKSKRQKQFQEDEAGAAEDPEPMRRTSR